MAKSAGDGPGDANGARSGRKVRKPSRRGPTAFQRLRQAVVKEIGIGLSAAEAADLYWRTDAESIAIEDDRKNRPQTDLGLGKPEPTKSGTLGGTTNAHFRSTTFVHPNGGIMVERRVANVPIDGPERRLNRFDV